MTRDERGFTTIQYVVATGFSLVFFVLLANLLVDLYARGAVRDGLAEGVRAAVPASAGPADYEARARAVVRSIAGGSVVRIDELRCEITGPVVEARASVVLRSWLPMAVPDWRVELRAMATRD
jgi:hypothetical protein